MYLKILKVFIFTLAWYYRVRKMYIPWIEMFNSKVQLYQNYEEVAWMKCQDCYSYL